MLIPPHVVSEVGDRPARPISRQPEALAFGDRAAGLRRVVQILGERFRIEADWEPWAVGQG